MTHLFSFCPRVLSLWTTLQNALLPNIIIDDINAKSAILGFYDASPENFNLVNHILLIFKLYIYHSRENKAININRLKNKLSSVARLECALAPIGTAIFNFYQNKWAPVAHLFPQPAVQ